MSLRQQLARRLEAINRYGIRGEPPKIEQHLAGDSRTLATLFPTGRQWTGDCGACWVLSYDLRQEWPEAQALLARLRSAIAASPGQDVRGWPAAWLSTSAASPKLIGFDMETCGFSSAPAFLVGLVETDGRFIHLHQGLARDYSEEAALLEWTASHLSTVGGIITFNGRTFDLPYLRDRQRYHRQRPLGEVPHLDLLHVARRIWGEDLPDCRLQTLEHHLTGKRRYGDIPGREIPDLYRAFVDSGDAVTMRRILHHNRRDLITLFELFVAAWHHVNATPHSQDHHEDSTG